MAETALLAYRFRVQAWTGLLVLQVRVRCTDGPCDSNGMPTSLAGEHWRDAQPEDLLALPVGEQLTRTR